MDIDCPPGVAPVVGIVFDKEFEGCGEQRAIPNCGVYVRLVKAHEGAVGAALPHAQHRLIALVLVWGATLQICISLRLQCYLMRPRPQEEGKARTGRSEIPRQVTDLGTDGVLT